MPKNDLWDYCHKYIGASDAEAHHHEQARKAREDKEAAERAIKNILIAHEINVARLDHCRIVRLIGGRVEITEPTDAIGLRMPEPSNGKRYREIPAEPVIPGNGDCCRRRPSVPADASLALDAALAQPDDSEIDEAAAFAAFVDGEVA